MTGSCRSAGVAAIRWASTSLMSIARTAEPPSAAARPSDIITMQNGHAVATVSAPVTWDELPDVETEDFTLVSMQERFARLGDVQAGIDDVVCDLEVLLEWVERDEAEGVGEAPYPPNFPKMPGEPKRVQPSRDTRNKKQD